MQVFAATNVMLSPGSGLGWHILHCSFNVPACALWLNGMGCAGASCRPHRPALPAPERTPPTTARPNTLAIPAPPLTYSRTCHVPRRLGILFVPLRRLRAVGHIQHAERYRHVHLRHIVVIQLRPLVADAMIVGIHVRHRKRGRRNARVGKGGIVAAAEERIAVLLVLHHLHASLRARLCECGRDVAVIEARQIELRDLRRLRCRPCGPTARD